MTHPDVREPSSSASTDGPKTKRGEPQKGASAARTPSLRSTLPTANAEGAFDLEDSEFFLNRELTWLNFNFRVLHEAEDSRIPLLERLRFVAIVSANLDEFFMKRIGGLKQQVGAGVRTPTKDGLTPQGQIDACHEVVRRLEGRKRKVLASLFTEMASHGLEFMRFPDLPKSEREELTAYYLENIYPLVTPQATDPAHPFPFVSNLSLNLLVTLHHPGSPISAMARVKIPVGSGVPRFMRVREGRVFVPMESVIAGNLELLFPGMIIDSMAMFRVTRNANTERDEEGADDLLVLIESEVRDRKFAPIVRLEASSRMGPEHRGMLAAELGLDETADVFEVDGLLGMNDVMELASLPFPELRSAAHRPLDHPAFLSDRNIFHILRDAGSVLVHHPYCSFKSSVERFLKEASRDPKVRAIKMSLYRTSANTRVVEYLMDAARNGKQVAVVLELKARFDEAANIGWATQLEEVGVHVTYGVVGLKTHCKVILVIRTDYDGLRRYAHIGTGNYHAGTARQYSDLGLFTCDPQIGRDLTELFNYLTTGFKPKRNYLKILPAPKHCRESLLEKIEREIAVHREGRGGLIQFKVNALEDVAVTTALYRASQAGVKIDLIVRDSCRLRPKIPHVSDKIRVISIVGRFLEHARIYYFQNGGNEEFYIGSADSMKRNLTDRVEVLAPVEDPAQRRELRIFLDCQLNDQRSAWEMQADGSYVQRMPASAERSKGSQDLMVEWYEARHREATRLRRRRPRMPGRTFRDD